METSHSPEHDNLIRVGVDTGGTFTDFVFLHAGKITIHKVFSTPSNPAAAILLGLGSHKTNSPMRVIHGTTVATNALLERRGAKTALITSKGMRDIVEIGRQDRPNLYSLTPQSTAALVPAELRFALAERLTETGEVLHRLEVSALNEIIEELQHANVESIAISLLYSFLEPSHEQVVRDEISSQLNNQIDITLSSELLPEYREFERTSTTILNAYVTPIITTYLNDLTDKLKLTPLEIMQSNGGTISPTLAKQQAARTALSGPAAGTVGALHIAERAGYSDIITFDMGGTSTDVALLPGELPYTQDATIIDMPLRLPTVDIHTVGAGGGSLAWVDGGGALRVGPQSAGADPGPAAYGKVTHATTTDANLVLGRLQPDRFLGGSVLLDNRNAEAAVSRLTDQLSVGGFSVPQTAHGIIQVANAIMARAIRRVSVERGYDPRQFALVPFGGAGPLHACELADELQIPTILVPRTPGVLSALGLVTADTVQDYSRALLQQFDPEQPIQQDARVTSAIEGMTKTAIHDLQSLGFSDQAIIVEAALDMRYKGQSHELTIKSSPSVSWEDAFHEEHQRLYGHKKQTATIEVVTVRVFARGKRPLPAAEILPDAVQPLDVAATGDVWFNAAAPTKTVFIERESLSAGHQIAGPAIIFQFDTTTVITPGWNAKVDQWGNLILRRQNA